MHDCFTIAELLDLRGDGPDAPVATVRVRPWRKVDHQGPAKLPINPSGGLKAKGHPIGATGVSMHVMAAMQVRGDAGAIQVPDARLAGVFNMGGSAVANYASILEPLR